MRQHSVTTHPEELEKIPNFFSKIKKSLDEEENIHFKSQFEKIEENSLWNFYKPCENNQNEIWIQSIWDLPQNQNGRKRKMNNHSCSHLTCP